ARYGTKAGIASTSAAPASTPVRTRSGRGREPSANAIPVAAPTAGTSQIAPGMLSTQTSAAQAVASGSTVLTPPARSVQGTSAAISASSAAPATSLIPPQSE